MSTVRTCVTPNEGWALYSHFLGNQLLIISMQGWEKGEETEEEANKRERVVHDAWTKLAGCLYMIMRRMKLNGHEDTATKMQQIIDMVVEQDLTDPEVCKAIHAKHKELDTSQCEFEEGLARFQAELQAERSTQ